MDIVKLIEHMEQWIEDDYKFLSTVEWAKGGAYNNPPDRQHPSFIEMAQTRLVMRYGFSVGMRQSFEIKYHLKGLEKTDNE